MQNLPNLLTLFRIAMIPAVYATFYIAGGLGDWLALIIFSVAGLTDFFDGWLARKYNVQSGFGRMLDPIADKLMVATCLMLLVGFDIVNDWHMVAAVIILCREVLVSGLREYLMELRVALPVSTLAKYKTTIQMVAIGFLLSDQAGESLISGAHVIGLGLLWLAAILTLITGYDYVRQGMKHADWSDS
ncbi:MAG: CDP-diacylglycerol--glycerol-3-phosphate 3-phosphatidyltransferase [Rhodobiaceae bacterium]|jgi:cardiolipin synthase|nr:CDP-diacylglycerol--glycerol-3-phosphate 3-phosphatidyltransferase [Rhodobiaceae bacterium]MBT7279646.1 CDP-diacylglycerol--glycerol-3-phosphate 3-phosphatidyltransferase [Rhodobiaceae bacterium]MDG2495691.1 CDP-diacylglycerol--glycerol-3-phosphate 3-phosphatidyltransferase [Alphaproteobacteria bacterium]